VSLDFQLQPGVQAFPGYCLHLPLGRGGCGEVWEASGPDGHSMALKFMKVRDTTAATRESKSIQAIRGLRHPYLLRIEQVFLQPGYVVIAMELAEGSLMDLLEAYTAERGTPVPVSEVLGYLSDAAQAIDFLNARQHVLDGRQVAYQHCDIKPSNLLIVAGHCKLADFGLATSVTTSLTRTFNRTGTLEFASPEVYRGQLSDQSDQYALAVTYCLLRGGRLPFADTPTKFMATYSRPSPDLTMLPFPERPIIARALAPSPIQRWPSCVALIAQLKRANEPAAAPRKAFA
jgi:serine/threonine-protein kinase